jgi:hypothetical protein
MAGINRYLCLSAMFFTLSLICLCISEPLSAQVDSRPDSAQIGNKEGKVHSLYAGAGFGSDMVWLGSTISGSLPYYSVSLIYGFKNSLYFSGSASIVNGLKPYPAFYNLSTNYSHTFNKWFDISADLAGFKTREILKDTLFSDFGYINLTGGFDWQILYTRISFSGVFSNDNKGYIQIMNSRYFETGDFLNGNASVSINPGFNILSGEIIEIVTTTGTKKYGLSPPFRHYKKNQGSTTESIKSKFGVLDFEFSLPVTFNYNNASIEVESDYLIPAYKNSSYPAPKGFTIYISLYLRIY